MKAREMVPGVWYCQEGQSSIFELRFFSKNDRGQEWAIVSEPGEEDMQSQWGIPIDSDVYKTARQRGSPPPEEPKKPSTVHSQLMAPPEDDL